MKQIIKQIAVALLLIFVSIDTSIAADRCEIDKRMVQVAKDLEKNPKLYDLIALDYDWADTYNTIKQEGMPDKNRDLSIAQIAAIYHYSKAYPEHFRKLNSELRTGVLSKHSQKFHQLLKSALSKLPDRPGTSYRGAGLQESALQHYKNAFENNTPVTEKHFTSSSTEFSEAENFALLSPGDKRTSTIFTIKGKNGKDIQQLSDVPSEAEVVFSSNGKFRVTDYKEAVLEDGTKRVLITLEEI